MNGLNGDIFVTVCIFELIHIVGIVRIVSIHFDRASITESIVFYSNQNEKNG